MAAIAGALFVGACSTPGPLHVYSVAATATEIRDQSPVQPDGVRDCPSYLQPGDVLTGFAYDPFTDHFFLRLAPGNHVRVVDRPARKIKREFDLAGVPPNGGGDVAVCPRDGHLFLVDPASSQLIETTRLGEFERRIALDGQEQPAAALAFDAAQNELLVLRSDQQTLARYDRTGHAGRTVKLDQKVARSIGYDSDRGELYAPLVGEPARIGVFDASGHRTRTLPVTSGDQFVDVGPHSFLRVF